MKHKATRILSRIFWAIVSIIALFAFINYPGRGILYIAFTVVLNALFIFGFTRGRIYFDTFIGIFFWLGFWLKYSLRMAFLGGAFQAPELIGKFAGTGVDHDYALLVVSCGICGLLIASLLRRKFLFSYADIGKQTRLESIFTFYRRHRMPVLVVFFFMFAAVAVSNVALGIYQRGTLPKTLLPFGLSGVYTWLLLFGLTSVSAVILDCEFRLKQNPYFASIIAIVETFFSNVSMLSRGMILNGGALLLGMHDNAKKRSQNPGPRYKLAMLVIFISLFVCSVFVTNHVRNRLFYSDFPSRTSISKSFLLGSVLARFSLPPPVIEAITGVETLLIDRWIGIEGVMSVVSHKELGWDLWKDAWKEKYSHSGTSMYDLVILGASLEGLKNHHFISIPGIVAFFYYPGSIAFLFVSMLALGFLAAGIEIFVYKLSGANLIVCSLMGQVIAYRYAHFGYVPAQSYLLFGSLFINILMIYFINRILCLRYGTSTALSTTCQSAD